MSEIAKPDFDELSSLSKKLSSMDRSLSEVINREDREVRAVRSAASKVRSTLAVEALDQIPVRELAREKSGIKVSALEKAGIKDLGTLWKKASWRIDLISGIGYKQAREIREALGRYKRKLEGNTYVRISDKTDSKENRELISALYIYIHNKKLRNEAWKLYDEHHDDLAAALSRAKLKNSISWAIAGELDRANTLNALAVLQGYMSEGWLARCEEIIEEHKTVLAADFETMREDFAKNSADYYAALEALGEEASAAENAYKDLPAELAAEVRDQQVNTGLLNVTLRPYQLFGAKYILHQGNVLLGDDMGLGKTITAIAAMASLAAADEETLPEEESGSLETAPEDDAPAAAAAGDKKYFLAVVPASVLINWTREIEDRSFLKPYLIHGKDEVETERAWLANGGVAVTNYENTGDFISILEDPASGKPSGFSIEMMVIDEGHYIKNPEAKRTKNLVTIAGMTQRILMMTGTPLENRVDEMCSLVGYLRPDLAKEIVNSAFMNKSDQFRKLLAPVYLRRVKEDVLSELPSKIESEEWCSMTYEDLEAYKKTVDAGTFMSMRRVSWLQDDVTKSSKAGRLRELCETAMAEGRKVIVFSFYRDTLNKVLRLLGDVCMDPITGDVSAERRQTILDEFKDDENPRVLVSQIQAGGTGLNVQCASVIIFCEPQIKPSLETQAIARAYRMGQKNTVLVYRLLCHNTIDEEILDMLKTKQDIFDEYAAESDVAEADKLLAKAETEADEETKDAAGKLTANKWIQLAVEKEKARLKEASEEGGLPLHEP
ncbi:MAG: DEAD/DEAH box helicase [Lachnospiraceae bacterium]|nr:DEAD/DEAH box helicase [Lachnospiraceae bacterium]